MMELHSKIFADGMAPVHGYNARSEVVSALMGTNTYGYAYDPIGNRLFASHNSATNIYAANCLNQYTTISNLCDLCVLCGSNNVPFHYDADGNMTADERGWHYAWNGENRMVCASNEDVVVTYAYDHRGRMARKTVANGDAVPKSVAYLWDDWNIIRETTTNLSTFQPFNFSTSYVWGLDLDGTFQGAGGVGGLLAVVRDDGVFLPAYDANGNITEYAATNGTVAAHYEYSAFGEPIVSDDELASSFAHQFSTKPYCNITDFNEYVYRKYRPDVGRWMSRDPIGDILFRKHMGHAIRAKSREDNRTWYENVIAQDNPYRYDSLANGYDILGLFPAEDILACVQRCLEMSRHVPGITKFAENCINACDYNPYNVPTIPDLLTPPSIPPSWNYCYNGGNWLPFLEILKAFWKGFWEGLWD